MIDPEYEIRLNSITSEMLTPLVADALGSDTVQIVDKQYDALHGGMGGLYRFRGRAKVQNQVRQWQLILKIILADFEFYSNDPTAWNYWKREALAYQSGLLDDLPGRLTAPRCFGIHNLSENEIWIWLEAIPGETIVKWPLDRYGLAARHLGQFNCAYLTRRSLPSHSWFSHGRLDEWLVVAEDVIPRLFDFLRHPHVKMWFSDDAAERTKLLWSRRQELLDKIEKLPRTLCHHDAFRRNLIAGNDRQEHDITFAVDWSMIGHGIIGEEIATTFTVTLQFLDCDAKFAPQLDKLIYEGYLTGLREAGWTGNQELVRFGFISSAVLFMALGAVGAWLPWLIEENGQEEIEDYLQQPIEKVLEQWSRMQAYLLDIGDEALALQEVIE